MTHMNNASIYFPIYNVFLHFLYHFWSFLVIFKKVPNYGSVFPNLYPQKTALIRHRTVIQIV
jgi:hypothetical protein